MHIRLRKARTPDVAGIRGLINTYTDTRRVLDKSTVTLYEDIQEFWVAEATKSPAAARGATGDAPATADGRAAGFPPAGTIVGCGALHVLWEDLAEVRTVAVDPQLRGHGVGHRIVTALLDTAVELGVHRVFCLTFETDFFSRHGFRPIQGTPVSAKVYRELLASYDEGVAEFLGLERVKPNTLGNTRMLRYL